MIISDPTYDKNVYIHRSDAEYRVEHIENVSYKVDLALPKGDNFWGRVTIQFDVKKVPPKSIFLDFRGLSISHLTINGNENKDDRVFRDHKIYINSQYLKKESKTTIEMNIFNKYRKDGHGIHSFTDLEDNEQYLFTQFETDFCHFVFPVFEQPDLKAPWTLSVVAPEDWAVIANTFQEEQTEDKKPLQQEIGQIFGQEQSQLDATKTFTFKKSHTFSSYLYAIVAGAYKYYEKIEPGFTPMRIYARKSVFDSVNHEEMFKVTQAGMTFYKELFGKDYPFTKYDQVFVAEHNSGAMENVGCVTFNEAYLYRGEFMSLAKRLRFAITNLHELAHMWFGNLVTMKWWNDLWLNESFATFMSFVAMSESPDTQYFTSQWVTFLQYKYWGISEDQLSTTHPIMCVINSTDEAETIFDGISYGKGASFLKQLYNLVGRDIIKQGLHQYFEKYQWQNTELKDFVGSINDAYKATGGNELLGKDFNLSDWCDQWLTTSGVNILEPIVEYKEDGSIGKLQIKQTCDLRGKNILRMQRIDVALYDQDFNQIIIKDVILSDTNELNDVEVIFKGPVQAILINVNDHGYAKVRFDQKSLHSFEDNLYKVEDALSRATIWRQFWLLVMDKQMSSLKYLNFVIKQLPYEEIDQILLVGLMNLRALLEYYIPTHLVIPKSKELFQTLVELLQKPNLTESVRFPLVDGLFGFIQDIEHTKLAMKWLEKSYIFKTDDESTKVFELSKKHKYAIVKIIFKDPEIPKEQKFEILEKTLGDDKSDIAQNTRETCMALLHDPETKAQIWKQIIDPESKESKYTREAKMAGFYNWRSQELVKSYFDKFYDALPMIYETQPYKYVKSFYYTLLPRMEVKDEHIVKMLSIKLKNPDNKANFALILNEGIELLMRTKEIREFALKE